MTDVTLNDLGQAIETFKAEHTKQLEELKKGKADAVLAEKVERVNDAITTLEIKLDEAVTESKKVAVLEQTIEEMEAKMKAPTRVASYDGGMTPAQAEHKNAFLGYIRARHLENSGSEAKGLPEEMMDASVARQRLVEAQKAVTIGSGTAGGHGVPAPIAAQVLQKVLDISPITADVMRTSVSSPLYERLVDTRGFASGWAGEGTTRSETNTPVIQQVTFTHGELYAVPKASNWSLNDIMFGVEAWLVNSAAEEYAYQIGAAITSGDGSNKPTGILSGTPVATGDEDSPARAFQVVQYLPTGAAASFQNDRLGSPAGDPAGVFIDAEAALKPRYHMNAKWYANRNTVSLMRKFRDADGNYLWERSLIVGQPPTFLGYPVINNEHLANVGANAFPVIFGDLGAAYELIDIQGMRLIRDEVTSKGHTLFYMAQRFGGNIVNDDAVKVIKCATS